MLILYLFKERILESILTGTERGACNGCSEDNAEAVIGIVIGKASLWLIGVKSLNAP